MKYLKQTLCTKTDSFSYTLLGGSVPLYHVDSSGYLTEQGKQIGKFSLRDNQWHLYLGDTLFMSGRPNGLFNLPEFELKALNILINKEQPDSKE